MAEWLTRRRLAGLGVAVFFALFFIMAVAAAYEIIEWQYAVIDGGSAGIEFLGSQGDGVGRAERHARRHTWRAHLARAVSGFAAGQAGRAGDVGGRLKTSKRDFEFSDGFCRQGRCVARATHAVSVWRWFWKRLEIRKAV